MIPWESITGSEGVNGTRECISGCIATIHIIQNTKHFVKC